MTENFEILLSEKNDLERALSSVQELLTTTIQEKEQVHKLLDDFKSHFTVIQN